MPLTWFLSLLFVVCRCNGVGTYRRINSRVSSQFHSEILSVYGSCNTSNHLRVFFFKLNLYFLYFLLCVTYFGNERWRCDMTRHFEKNRILFLFFEVKNNRSMSSWFQKISLLFSFFGIQFLFFSRVYFDFLSLFLYFFSSRILSGNALSGSIPPHLGRLKELTSLWIIHPPLSIFFLK